ncbi:MAG: Rne/Rng family ribonuclease [Desulfovibrio desulfuricans]|nr:Rne/Rng family ribonuclease [Desulfovibrio desulfuricans]
MTAENDSPAAAAQAAADQASQEAPEAKRAPASRSRGKTSAGSSSGKTSRKNATPASAATPDAAADAPARPKRASRPRKTATTAADSGEPPAPAPAAETTGKTRAVRATVKKTAKTSGGSTAARGRKAAAPAAGEAAPAAETAADSQPVASPAGTAGRGRSRARARAADTDAGATESAATPPASPAVPAEAPTEPADEAESRRKAPRTATGRASRSRKRAAAPAHAASSPDTDMDVAPAVHLPPAAEDAPRPADATLPVPAAATEQADREAADDAPAAAPAPTADAAADEAGTEADTSADTSEAPRRKNRRGRRGGRGRNRKKEQSGQAAATETENEEARENLPDEAETRPQNGQSGQGKATEAGKSLSKAAGKAKRRMFISVLPGEEVEVALAEDGQMLEYYLDMLHQRKLKGNIYKGVIHNIDTNLQAAFVSYGSGKNGFLQIDEVHPEYWLTHYEPSKGKKFPPIQKVLKAGQEVLVQVVKEPTGNKGAFLTTWLSLAGRFLVLTPGQEQIGVSRKVEDEEERARLREMMNGIDPGQGLGVIVRTVSAGTTKTTLKNDLQYLKRVWRDIRKKGTEVAAPALIYQEPGLSERAVRDYLTDDVTEIWVDNEDVAQSIRETVSMLFPRKKDLVHMHTDTRTSMWERFNLRRQLEQIYSREVLLPSGGRLVFDQTEALMAIDINSGKISGKGNFEAMAHKTNMEAAETIARHLKLRDIGGQVVIDFIEMRDKKHVAEVEKTLRVAMKNDRARHDVARMSSFGLLELVRQRTGSSALSISLEPCPACGGTGMRRNIEWQALQALRELRRLMSAETKDTCVYQASAELALYLLNHKRDSLREIERDYGKCLEIAVRP